MYLVCIHWVWGGQIQECGAVPIDNTNIENIKKLVAKFLTQKAARYCYQGRKSLKPFVVSVVVAEIANQKRYYDEEVLQNKIFRDYEKGKR